METIKAIIAKLGQLTESINNIFYWAFLSIFFGVFTLFLLKTDSTGIIKTFLSMMSFGFMLLSVIMLLISYLKRPKEDKGFGTTPNLKPKIEEVTPMISDDDWDAIEAFEKAKKGE